MKHHFVLATLAIAAPTATAQTAEYPSGYLCCNMRTDGSWISDSNYQDVGKTGIPVGMPAKVTGYGRNRVHVEINGQKQAIGNDYSRAIPLEAFARRYVVAQDPIARITTFPNKIQLAIANARVTPGMTREQVLMAIGYPIADENPDLNSKKWRYWLSSFAEFIVFFNDAGLLEKVETGFDTRSKVFQE